MLLIILLLITFRHHSHRNKRRHHRSHNSDVGFEVVSADTGNLDGIKIGPYPRRHKYRVTRLLDTLNRRLKENKQLASVIEQKGRSGIESLLKRQLGMFEPYLTKATVDYVNNKKSSLQADEQLNILFDNLTKTFVQKLGGLFQ